VEGGPAEVRTEESPGTSISIFHMPSSSQRRDGAFRTKSPAVERSRVFDRTGSLAVTFPQEYVLPWLRARDPHFTQLPALAEKGVLVMERRSVESNPPPSGGPRRSIVCSSKQLHAHRRRLAGRLTRSWRNNERTVSPTDPKSVVYHLRELRIGQLDLQRLLWISA
jgi:hypothetical protein